MTLYSKISKIIDTLLIIHTPLHFWSEMWIILEILERSVICWK